MLAEKNKPETNIISVVNQKGGVGKTTTAINLATSLSAIYQKTLLIDLDPQGNASSGLGINNNVRSVTIYDLLVNDADLDKAILPTEIPYLSIITSTVDLAAAEIELANFPNKEYVLKKIIDKLNNKFDYIIIDCPPSLGMLTINSLAASNNILIPLQCEFYALEGLSHLLKTVDLIKKRINSKLEILGIVLTMYDKRNRLTQQVEIDVQECLGEYLLDTKIPRNIRVSEAPSFGKPVLIYDIKCSGSLAYIYLAKEILEKINARKKMFV